MQKANEIFVGHTITHTHTKARKAYHLILMPFVMIAAVVLFILDNLNVNVTPIVSYILKETK